MKTPEYITPAITLFAEDGTLDAEANVALWKRQVENGIDGILIEGSNGEFYTMDVDERVALAKLAVDSGVAAETKVIVGTGCNSIDATVDLSNRVLATGIKTVMVVPPFYFVLGREALLQYYKELASRVDGDIFLYNFPARTGNDLDAGIVVELVQSCPNIIGIKDTVTEMGHTRAIIDAVADIRPDFIVYSGFDENFAHNVLAGGNGCIAALGNVFPELVYAWAESVADKDFDRIEKIQHIIDGAAKIYEVAPLFVPAIKYAVSQRGLAISQVCRCTPLALTASQKEEIERILSDAEAQIAKNSLL